MLIADPGCCCWLLLLVAAGGCCCWLLLLVVAVVCSESLWKISGCCWKVFEYFQVVDEKSSNISRILMKDFEYFQNIDEKSLNISRILMRGRWKRVSPRETRVVDGRKRVNKMAVHWVFILVWSRAEQEPIGSFGEKLRASRSALQNLWLRQVLELS